jgi:DNA polymerase IV
LSLASDKPCPLCGASPEDQHSRADRIRKSIGAENTFSEDLQGFEPMHEALQPIIQKVWRHCEQTGTRGRTATLKVKFADFEKITRSRSVGKGIASQRDLHEMALDLLRGLAPMKKRVRLLGITLSSLCSPDDQPSSQMSLEL